jgi:hypothetical protein
MPTTAKSSAPTDSPVYWFVVLHQARDSGDFATAAQAVRELERLGVSVIYRAPHREVARAHFPDEEPSRARPKATIIPKDRGS